MNFYISFGQTHAHRVNGVTFARNSLALIVAPTHDEARRIAFELFGPKFCTSYTEDQLPRIIHHFPRGVIAISKEI